MGTLYSRIAGPNDPRTGIPNNVVIPAEAVLPNFRFPTNFETDSLRKLVQASQNLGAQLFLLRSVRRRRTAAESRIAHPARPPRRSPRLLNQLDSFRRQADRTRGFESAAATISKPTISCCAASARRSICRARIRA